MSPPKACVLVPVYRAALSEDEHLSLRQTHRILAAHPRIAVGPRALFDARPDWLDAFTGTECFDEGFFSSIAGYNTLMVDPAFYARFAQYEYLLICQTDALPFHDALAAWCDRGYDYLGAPWLEDLTRYRFKSLAVWRHHRRALRHQRAGRLDAEGHPTGTQFSSQVGNGGFSLRRGAALQRALHDHSALRERYLGQMRAGLHRGYNEDVFFSVALSQANAGLRIPRYDLAMRFSIENAVPWALQQLRGELPFGCHAWAKHREHWRAVFERLGIH